MCQVKRELARIEAAPLSDLKSSHLVLVVPDEKEGCSAAQSFPVHFDAKIEKGEATKYTEEGPGEGRPLAHPGPLLFGNASLHDVRINSKTGIVDKDASIDLAHIDRGDVSIDQGLNGSFEIGGNAQILREMI